MISNENATALIEIAQGEIAKLKAAIAEHGTDSIEVRIAIEESFLPLKQLRSHLNKPCKIKGDTSHA